MKEILFKGKRKDNNEWVYGWYAPLVCNDKTVIPSIKDSNGSDWRVEPETVSQFTGLTDKNGKKIFEGDIIKYCDEDIYYYPEDCTEFFGEIVQECGAFGIGTQNELPLELENWCSNDNFVSLWEIYWNLNCCGGELSMIEVIGNVYDNKELLEND